MKALIEDVPMIAMAVALQMMLCMVVVVVAVVHLGDIVVDNDLLLSVLCSEQIR